MLSYIDVRHRGFLPSGLTVGEAQDLSPWLIIVGSLLPVRDGITDTVFQGCAEHIPVKQLSEGVLAAEQVEFELVDSLKAKADDLGEEMVVRRNTIAVDTEFCLPSICVLDPKKSKNIIFSPWGRKNI